MEVIAKAGLPSVGVTPCLSGHCPICNGLFIITTMISEEHVLCCNYCSEVFLVDLEIDDEIEDYQDT